MLRYKWLILMVFVSVERRQERHRKRRRWRQERRRRLRGTRPECTQRWPQEQFQRRRWEEDSLRRDQTAAITQQYQYSKLLFRRGHRLQHILTTRIRLPRIMTMIYILPESGTKNPTSTYMCGSLRRPRALTKICNLFKFYVCARVVDLEILVALLQLGAAFFVLTNHFKTWKKNCINVTVNMSEIIKKRRERNIPKNVLFYVMCCY